MSDKKLFSVAIPTFNRAKYLAQTLDSVLGQSHAEIELCVADGASTDGTREILESYALKDSRLRFISEPDSSHTEGINKALALCKGQYVAFLGSDDLLLPGALARAAELFETYPEFSIISGQSIIIDQNGNELPAPLSDSQWDFARVLCREYVPSFEGAFFRAELLKGFRFDPRIKAYADYNMWLTLASQHNVLKVPEWFAKWRLQPESASGDPNNISNLYHELLLCQKIFFDEHPEATKYQHLKRRARMGAELERVSKQLEAGQDTSANLAFLALLAVKSLKMKDVDQRKILGVLKRWLLP